MICLRSFNDKNSIFSQLNKLPLIFFTPFLLVAGCASGVSQGVAPPVAATSARLIIYRTPAFIDSARSPTININGVDSCSLGNGAGFQKDVPQGIVTISTQFWDSIGTSKISFTALANRVYYVKFSLDEGEAWSGATAGIVGASIEQLVSKHSGPFDISLTNQTAMGSILPGICAR